MPTINQTHRKINDFADVSIGWHFGEGTPADEKTVSFAHLLNEELGKSGFRTTNAFLAPGGQIQVNGYQGNYFLELIVDNGRIYFLFEDNRNPVAEEKNLTIRKALSMIHLRGILLWDTLDSSTQKTSISNEESSPMPPYSSQAVMVSQSWMVSALTKAEKVSVSTLESTSQEWEENHPFSLKSPRNIYQLNATS